MKAKFNQWITASVGILALSLLPVADSFGQGGTPCDIELTKSVYNVGDVVEASVLVLTNPSQEAQQFEWKLWLESPDLPTFSFVNFGSDGSFVLPGGFSLDFVSLLPGNLTLFTVDDVIFPRGDYVIGCRFLDPVTGEEYPAADVIQFEVI